MSAIRAVIWDFAGVVLHTVKGTFNSLLAERLDVPISQIEKVMASPENDLWDINEIDDETYYTFILDELKQPHEKIAIIQRFVVKDFYIDQRMLEYIKALRKEYISVLLTNFPAHIHKFIKTDWIINGAFDHFIASCDVKLIKPDPAMYQLTLDRIGCTAQECVFIDDREINVRAAKALGMYGILFKDQEQTIQDLQNLLIA
jgi:putative hydrolase of the HAD superfamily